MAKEKKLDHIQVKDNGIKTANKVGDALNEAKQLLTKNIFEGLLTGTNETNLVRYKIAQNNALKSFEVYSSKIIQKAETMAKNTLKNSNVNLKPSQVTSMTHDIKKGLLFLQKDAVSSYRKTLTDILLSVKSAEGLKEQLAKHIESGLNIGVVYENKREYKFDSYFEMKARTEIQRDIGSNMVQAGQDAGVVFYISAYFGDCAPDHALLNGKLFCDEKWESLAPKDRVEEIRSYIESNKIMTVQEAMGEPYYYTTRPNCRHYFQYISIDEVLGAKTPEEVKKLRDEKSLNFNGKYKPDKYKALQQQRLNERKIRAEKANIQTLEIKQQLEPDNKNLQIQINNSKASISFYQAKQRKLESQYANIERRYDREALGNRVDLGVEINSISEKYESIDRAALRKMAKVNSAYLKSKEYNEKYDHLFENENPVVIRAEAKTHINNHKGEISEGYSIIESNGDVFRRGELGEFGNGAVDLSGTNRMKDLIFVHNHPTSSAFSDDDLRFLISNKQVKTLVIGAHDGTVYKLTILNREKIPSDIENKFNSVYNIVRGMGGSIAEATHEACDLLNKFGFDYRKE